MFYENTALIFEGGGMRNAYTAAVVETLLENNIIFPKVYGISAGTVLAACYASRDPRRAKATFTESVRKVDKNVVANLLRGEGVFDLQYILEGLSEMNAVEDNEWTFHFERFKGGETDVHIEAFNVATGDTVAWTREDMHTLTDVMERVRASCSYPLFTPLAEIDGQRYVDGGMGTSHGICLDAAIQDGFERFFVVRTQERTYRMPDLPLAKKEAYRIAYAKYPKVVHALEARPQAYNRLLDRLEGLCEAGTAYVFCPDSMPISYKTFDYDALCKAYDLGLTQCKQELPTWEAWLEAKDV